MNRPRLLVGPAVVPISILVLAGFAGCDGESATPPETGTANKTLVTWRDHDWFLLGVNYPWLNYGHDFGATAWGHDGVSCEESRKQVDADFAYLKNHGVHVVRWFLFGDCRAAPEFDGTGKVTGFDDHFYTDLDAAVEIAQKHNVYLIFVLLDFHLADKAKHVNGVQLGGRSQIVTDAKARQSFLNNAVKPLLQRYGQNPYVIAWDVINEPEGAMDMDGGRWVPDAVPPAAMQGFVKEVVECIHANASQHATLGSASRRWLNRWVNTGLDFYQYHYYDKMEKQYPLDYSCARLALDKPCILGEFPTDNTGRTITQYLDTVRRRGHAGSLAWSYRAGDKFSSFREVAREFKAWSIAHHALVKINQKGE